MLHSYEADHSNVKNLSPLIMVPVELRRRSIKSKYKLYHSDDDPFINPALQYKLLSDFNVELPDLPNEDDEFDLHKYFLDIRALIDKNPKWKVTNEIFLGLFSFAKFVMFKDLEKHSDIFKNNGIIQALSGVLEPEQKDGLEDY